MGIKAENTQRIRELEAEFSDERIAEHFHVNGVDDMNGRSVRARRMRMAALRGVFIFAVAVLCAIAALQFYLPVIMSDDTMEDAIEKSDCVIVDRRAYSSSEISIGDIIAHVSPGVEGDGRSSNLITRVIGLPGDRIAIRGGSVYRNGERVLEPYLKDKWAGEALHELIVPEGCYFVLGDNRRSGQGAEAAFVPESGIRGKAVFRLLPVSRAGGL